MKIKRAQHTAHPRLAQWQTGPGRAERLPACADRYRTDRARRVLRHLRRMAAESGALLAVCAQLPQIEPGDLAHAGDAARALARSLGHKLKTSGRYHWAAQEGLGGSPWHIHATYPMPKALASCPQCGGRLQAVERITRQGEIAPGWHCSPCNLHARPVTDLWGHALYVGGPYQALAHRDPCRAADLALRARDRLGRPPRLSGTGTVRDLGEMLFTECRGALLLLGLRLLIEAARDRCRSEWGNLRNRVSRPVKPLRALPSPPAYQEPEEAAQRPAERARRPRAGPGPREAGRERARPASLPLTRATE